MCPGCGNGHEFRVDANKNSQNFAAGANNGWPFNGDTAKPTFYPSMLVRGTVPLTDDEVKRVMAGEKIVPQPMTCHSFVKDGEIQFLGDCTHKLKGLTVPLEDF